MLGIQKCILKNMSEKAYRHFLPNTTLVVGLLINKNDKKVVKAYSRLERN